MKIEKPKIKYVARQNCKQCHSRGVVIRTWPSGKGRKNSLPKSISVAVLRVLEGTSMVTNDRSSPNFFKVMHHQRASIDFAGLSVAILVLFFLDVD